MMTLKSGKNETNMINTKNTENIPGIYNYCDRWCERCMFTNRCLSYKTERKQKNELFSAGNDSSANTHTWDVIKESFEMAKELIREFAIKEGIDLDSLPKDLEFSKKQNIIEGKVKKHALVVAADRYLDSVTKWFDEADHLFILGFDDQRETITVSLTNRYQQLDIETITDAIEVIKWYQYQISVKLSKALFSKGMDEIDEMGGVDGMDGMERHDGSAKVALIGIDRSIGAWNVLLSNFRSEEDSILNILVCLGRLRNSVEKEFPTARGFVRPGFDD